MAPAAAPVPQISQDEPTPTKTTTMSLTTPTPTPAPPAALALNPVSNAMAPAAAPVPQISEDEPTPTNTTAMSLTTPTPAPPANQAEQWSINAKKIAARAHVTLLSTLKEIAQGSNQLQCLFQVVRLTGVTSIPRVLELIKLFKSPEDITLVSPPCTKQSCWNALNLLAQVLRVRAPVEESQYPGADLSTVGPMGVWLSKHGILEAYELLTKAGADSIWLLSTISSAKKMASLLGPEAPVALVYALWRAILSHRREARKDVDPDATDTDEEVLSAKPKGKSKPQGKKRARSDTDSDLDLDLDPADSQPLKRPTLDA